MDSTNKIDVKIDFVNKTIDKLIKTGYLHHIERLMIMGNFFLFC
jgi:deoxyribodipyrimidine photolyase-related protein